MSFKHYVGGGYQIHHSRPKRWCFQKFSSGRAHLWVVFWAGCSLGPPALKKKWGWWRWLAGGWPGSQLHWWSGGGVLFRYSMWVVYCIERFRGGKVSRWEIRPPLKILKKKLRASPVNLPFLSWYKPGTKAITRLRTRSAAVRHWRGLSLSAYERDLVTNEKV